ncbi:hypothetical protein [Nocardia sp. Marseille-Q1738]
MTEIVELVAAVNKLQKSVNGLTVRVNTYEEMLQRIEKVANDTQKVATDTRANRIGLKVATASIAFNLVLTAALGWLFMKVQDVQERTSTEILCPLYQVFAVSIKVNPPNPNLTPEQAKARREAADTILAGLDKLGCA